MEIIQEHMNPSEHCLECGAFIGEQCICGHCGYEIPAEPASAPVIPLVAAIGRYVPLSDLNDRDRRIA